MRTREEQIAELAKRFAWPSIRLEEGHIQDATGVIIEAERRAEQRVRAEIGRDSEQLDWLAAQFKTTTVYMSGDAIYAPSRLLFSLKGRGFRDAIDIAREVG